MQIPTRAPTAPPCSPDRDLHRHGAARPRAAHHRRGHTINTVTFTPGARTYWHTTRGQILVVTAGRAGCAPTARRPQLIRAGDVVWVPPGERHWHGGRPTRS